MIGIIMLTGCQGRQDIPREQPISESEREEEQEGSKNEEIIKGEVIAEAGPKADPGEINSEPEVVEEDWSEYFDGLYGAAVVYDASARRFTMYNSDLALTRRSPCSTFKIISSLTALENGIVEPDNSVRKWSGEVFWNENWNKDIDFQEAFRESCVWYFREVINEIGQELMQRELDRLAYGNCDISDWEGRQNTNNNNRALTGFWLESSLEISPMEQTEVMERIFGETSVYSKETQEELKKVMLVENQEESDIAIYGKTGMGKLAGIVVDAWFTGFAESAKGNIYFCVYLGQSDNENASSTLAKEIAVELVADYCFS